MPAYITIHTAFENASLAHWERKDDQDCIIIHPVAGGENRYPWFYFLISGVGGREWTFQVPALGRETLCPVSVSYDRVDWLPLAAVPQDGERVAFRHLFTADDAIISTTPPYTAGMLYDLTLWAARSPHARIEYIGREAPAGSEPLTCITISEMGRSSEKSGSSATGMDENASPPDRPAVWLIAREHPLEAAASWVAEGMVRFLLSADPLAAELRRRFVFKIVPILDVMGVFHAKEHAVTWGEGESAKATAPITERLARETEVALILNLRAKVTGLAGSGFVTCPRPLSRTPACPVTGKPGDLTPWISWTIATSGQIYNSAVGEHTSGQNGAPGVSTSAFLAYMTGLCPAASVGELVTSWYYPAESLNLTGPVGKTQYELQQEGEMILRALAAMTGPAALPEVPPLLMPRLHFPKDGKEPAQAEVWCAVENAEELEVSIAGEGWSARMAPDRQQGRLVHYSLTLPGEEAALAEYITARSRSGKVRRITFVERKNRSSDSSLL